MNQSAVQKCCVS